MGQSHTALITSQLQLYVMGDNSLGQLGLGSREIKSSCYPTLVSSMAGHNTSDVVCGFNHTLIQMGDRKVFGFGCNQFG